MNFEKALIGHSPRVAVITLLSARGGAGASTLGLALARTLHGRGHRISLIDEELWFLPDRDQLTCSDPDHVINVICRHQDDDWLLRSDHILLVVPAEVHAVANAVKRLPTLERYGVCSAVVRTPSPSGITSKKIEQLLGIPVVAEFKTDKRLAVLGEHGSGATSSLKKCVKDLMAFLDLDD